MACLSRRGFLCMVALIGVLAVSFHGFAYVAPGWIMMSRDVTKQECKQFETIGLTEEDLELKVPPQSSDRPVAMSKRSADTDLTTIAPDEDNLHGEVDEFKVWIVRAVADIYNVKLRVNYGLWFSTVCVQEKYLGTNIVQQTIFEEDEAVFKRSADSSESSDSNDDDDDKHRKCVCRRISTRCALAFRWWFQDYTEPEWYLSERHFGFASLTEHRIENSFAMFFLFVGFVAAMTSIGAKQKSSAGKAVIVCFISMLVACALTIVPVIRFGSFSMHKHNQEVPVYVHPPVSVICATVGSILGLIVGMLTLAGFARRQRQEKPGRWYQFNNELELPQEKSKEEKMPQLVFVSDSLPEKPGMDTDVEA